MYDLFAFVFQNSFLLRGIVLFLFGIIIGSFLNVVIYRLPIVLKRKWINECSIITGSQFRESDEHAGINLILPSSHCTLCKAKIPFWANVPILGYFLVNGKCFHCKSKISIRYPLVELVTGLLYVVAGYLTNDIIVLPGYLAFIAFTICLILIDYDTFLLPDELTLGLLWLGIVFNLNGATSGSLSNSILGAITGYGFFWVVFWAFKLITGKDGLGYGDFKFLAAILVWTGYQAIVAVLLISSVLGIFYFILAKLSGKLATHPEIHSHHIPFGPFLGIAGMITLLGGFYFNVLPF